MTWSHREVRRLLGSLDKPRELEKSDLALRLKDALRLDTPREAVLQVIHKTFNDTTPRYSLLRDVILLPDVKGDKRSAVASMLNLSMRTFFRQRAQAVELVANTIDRILNVADPRSDFKFETALMIGALKPAAVDGVLERLASGMGPEAAYTAILVTLRAGRAVSQEMLARCTGHYRLLAELDIARTYLSSDNPGAFRPTWLAVRESLADLQGPLRERVEFELAYGDRLDALRVCDVDRCAQATAILHKTSGADFRLRALASICRAEQACDEGDLDGAQSIIDDVQDVILRLNDIRISGRLSHAASIVNLLKGNFAESADLSRLTMAALDFAEPGFVPCAASVHGRALLLLGSAWERPDELCERFPQSYVTGLIDSVWARHLVATDARKAYDVAHRSALMASTLKARGTFAYALGTRSIAAELLGKRAKAQRERIVAWEYAVALRRPFYLYDFLVHPKLPQRALGAFDIDETFLAAIERRLKAVLQKTGACFDSSVTANNAIAQCLQAAVDMPKERSRFSSRWRRPRTSVAHKAALSAGLGQLSVELSYCLPVPDRTRFVDRFTETAADLLGLGPERQAQTI